MKIILPGWPKTIYKLKLSSDPLLLLASVPGIKKHSSSFYIQSLLVFELPEVSLPKTRREFLTASARTLTGAALISAVGTTAFTRSTKTRAILFDAFPVFDPRPVAALAEELFPGKGKELSDAWRTRQFEYTWLRNSMGTYRDFFHVIDDALIFAARLLKLDLTPEKRDRLTSAYLQLRAYPDVAESLKTLRAAGIKLSFLSNFTSKMMQAGIANSGLDDFFDHLLSTDIVQVFKPAPRAYQMGIDVLKLKREEIVFAAFAGWDAVGAKQFGYPTFWVNRANQPTEELGLSPDGMGSSLADLVKFAAA